MKKSVYRLEFPAFGQNPMKSKLQVEHDTSTKMSFHHAVTCVLILMLLMPLGLLLLARQKYIRGMEEKIFPEKQWSVWVPGRVYFDDFINKTYVRRQPKIRQLFFSISLSEPGPGDSLNMFYRRCAVNLNRAAPRLKYMSLNGGYIFNMGNATIEMLTEELRTLKHFFPTILQITRDFGWAVTSFDFNGVLVGQPELFKSSSFSKLVESVFSVQLNSTHNTQLDAKFQLTIDELPIRVYLSVSDNEMFQQAPLGRSKFYLPIMRIGIPPGGRRH